MTHQKQACRRSVYCVTDLLAGEASSEIDSHQMSQTLQYTGVPHPLWASGCTFVGHCVRQPVAQRKGRQCWYAGCSHPVGHQWCACSQGFWTYQGSLKGESVVAAILSSRMEQSYCTSGFFRFQARFLTSSAPILTITHYLRTVFHQTRNLTHLPKQRLKLFRPTIRPTCIKYQIGIHSRYKIERL